MGPETIAVPQPLPQLKLGLVRLPQAVRMHHSEALPPRGAMSDARLLAALQGILKHGYGRWKPVVDDTELDLQRQLRIELGPARPMPGRPPKVAGTDLASGGGGAPAPSFAAASAAASPAASGDAGSGGDAAPAPTQVRQTTAACGAPVVLRQLLVQFLATADGWLAWLTCLLLPRS